MFAPMSLAAVGMVFLAGIGGSGGETNRNFVASLDSKEVSAALLPAVEGFRLVDVREVSRSAGDVLGNNSVIATYQGHGMTAQFSVDGFYPSWHDLAICYTAMDWGVNQAQNDLQTIAPEDISANERINGQTRLEMYREGGERAYCLFSCYDAEGEFVMPNAASGSPFRKLVNRLKAGGLFAGTSDQSVASPVHQYQLFVTENRELLAHERAILEKLFVSVRDSCRKAFTVAPIEETMQDSTSAAVAPTSGLARTMTVSSKQTGGVAPQLFSQGRTNGPAKDRCKILKKTQGCPESNLKADFEQDLGSSHTLRALGPPKTCSLVNSLVTRPDVDAGLRQLVDGKGAKS
jgi:hypothetical protein